MPAPFGCCHLVNNAETAGTIGHVRFALTFDHMTAPRESVALGVAAEAAGADEVWETDHTGYTQVVQLDDHEASLLAAWARTGWWANPAAVTDVELSLARTDDSDAGFDASEECEVTVRVRAGEPIRVFTARDLDFSQVPAVR